MTEDDPILVSVAMITYNHERYVRQAIESIVSQEAGFKIELVIGEDFSKDSTRQICEEMAAKYPDKVRLLPTNGNLGVSPNFIRTLLACQGKFIALCEGDDYWTDPLKLQKQVDFLQANDSFIACYHDVQVVDESGTVVRSSKNSFINNRDLPQEHLVRGKVMSLAALCFRNVIKEFPEEFYKSPTGDNFLASLLGGYGGAKFLTNIKPSAYRMHSTGVWSLKDDMQKKMTLVLSYFWLWQYYERIGTPEQAMIFYRKIMLEGYYSNPFKTENSKYIDSIEFFVTKSIRKVFRILRRILS